MCNDIENKTYSFDFLQTLKHGENKHQKANLYNSNSLLDWKQLNGENLSYNDVLNATSALEISSEFFDVASCVIVKYTNPCAVALSSDINTAWDKAFDSDTISPFNGNICFTRKIEFVLAKKLSTIPLNMVIAPEFSTEALEELKKNKSIKIIQINTPYRDILNFNLEEIKLTPFGAIIQQKDTKDFDKDLFKVVTKKKPEQKEVEDMIFASKIVKHVKSNAVVVAKDLRTLGICASQTNMVDCVEIALSKVCDSPKDAVIACDTFIPAVDSINAAVQNRITGIIQPMGGAKDKEIIACADKLGISMISTGIHHLKH